jgi:hypothetical protein
MASMLDECVENFPNILALKDEQNQAIFNNFTSSKGRGRDPSDWFRKEFHLPVSSVRQQQIKDNVVRSNCGDGSTGHFSRRIINDTD